MIRLVEFTLQNLLLKYREPGYVAFSSAQKILENILWQNFGWIFQANSESIKCAGTLKIECTAYRFPLVQVPTSVQAFIIGRNRKGIVVVINKDNLCLPRVQVVAMAYAIKDPLYKLSEKTKGEDIQLQLNSIYRKGMQISFVWGRITRIR